MSTESKKVNPTSIKFDDEVEAILRDVCVRHGRSRKAVVQIAVIEYAERPLREPPSILEEITARKRGGENSLKMRPKREPAHKPRGRKSRKDTNP